MNRCVFVLMLAVGFVLPGRPAAAGPDCEPGNGLVLFSTIPSSHYRTMPHLRRVHSSLRAQHPGTQVELVRLRPEAARALLVKDRVKLQLRVFGECIPLPEQLFRKLDASGMRIYGARPAVMGPRAYVMALARDPNYTGPGQDDPYVFVSAQLAGGTYEIRSQLGGDPNFGRLYAVRRVAPPLKRHRSRPGGGLRRGPGPRPVAAPTRRPMPQLTPEEYQAVESMRGSFLFHVRRARPLDIAVGYTKETLDKVGSVTDIRAVALSGAQWFEDALTLSGLRRDVNITGVVATRIREMDYANSSGVVDAATLLDKAHVNWRLRKFRRRTHADFATLFADRISTTKGEAYIWAPLTWWPFGARGAYSVVSHQNAAFSAMAHECSHNIGGGHTTLTSTAQESYAHAWCINKDGIQWCTVLASGEVVGGFGDMQRYSDPDQPRGPSSTKYGTVNNDNVRLLERNLNWVAQWGEVIQILPP